MEMEVTFPGGVAVDANAGGFTVHTDQPVAAGGAGEAPSPFVLFLSSIGACAGYFALSFCQKRDLDTTGMKLVASFERDPETHRLEKAVLDLKLPEGFPDKYVKPIIRSMDQCSVKRTLLDPPDFEVKTS